MRQVVIILASCIMALGCLVTVSAGLQDHTMFKSISVCLDCHPRALPTHKRQTPQRMTEPLPLDEQGRMLCFTCHDCTNGTCLLRRDPARQLCIICHDCSRGMACLLGVAHMGGSPVLAFNAVSGCLGCHDGTMASTTMDYEGHPVDVMYIPSQKKQLKQVTDRRVLLVDGKVTCLSCHNPYGASNAYLSRSNEGSKLCMVCHLK